MRYQGKVLPSRSQLALLMELLINKRLANKFPVVCLLGGVLLPVPAMLDGFLGCLAPLDPKECFLLSMTSEAWLSSVCMNALQAFLPLQGSRSTLHTGSCQFAGFLPPNPAHCRLQQYLTLACAQLFLPPFFVFWARGLFCSQSTSSGRSAGRLYLGRSSFLTQYNHVN